MVSLIFSQLAEGIFYNEAPGSIKPDEPVFYQAQPSTSKFIQNVQMVRIMAYNEYIYKIRILYVFGKNDLDHCSTCTKKRKTEYNVHYQYG